MIVTLTINILILFYFVNIYNIFFDSLLKFKRTGLGQT